MVMIIMISGWQSDRHYVEDYVWNVRGWWAMGGEHVCLFSLWRVKGLAYVSFSCLLRSCYVTQNNRAVLEMGIRGQKNRSIWILQNYGLSRPWLTWYFCFNIQWCVKTNGTERKRSLFLIPRSVNFCRTKSWGQIGLSLILTQIKGKQMWVHGPNTQLGKDAFCHNFSISLNQNYF